MRNRRPPWRQQRGLCGKRRPSGIILAELLVALTIMAILLLVLIPNFQLLLRSSLDQETSRLGGLIRSLRNEAVLKGSHYRLMMDLRGKKYFIEERGPDGEYFLLDFPKELRPHSFPASIEVRELTILGETIRPERDIRPVPIQIDASGYIDPFTLRFTYSGDPYAFQVTGFTGKVSLVSGNEAR